MYITYMHIYDIYIIVYIYTYVHYICIGGLYTYIYIYTLLRTSFPYIEPEIF